MDTSLIDFIAKNAGSGGIAVLVLSVAFYFILKTKFAANLKETHKTMIILTFGLSMAFIVLLIVVSKLFGWGNHQ